MREDRRQKSPSHDERDGQKESNGCGADHADPALIKMRKRKGRQGKGGRDPFVPNIVHETSDGVTPEKHLFRKTHGSNKESAEQTFSQGVRNEHACVVVGKLMECPLSPFQKKNDQHASGNKGEGPSPQCEWWKSNGEAEPGQRLSLEVNNQGAQTQ